MGVNSDVRTAALDFLGSFHFQRERTHTSRNPEGHKQAVQLPMHSPPHFFTNNSEMGGKSQWLCAEWRGSHPLRVRNVEAVHGAQEGYWLRTPKLFLGRILLSVGESRCLVAPHTKMETHLLPTGSRSGACPLTSEKLVSMEFMRFCASSGSREGRSAREVPFGLGVEQTRAHI